MFSFLCAHTPKKWAFNISCYFPEQCLFCSFPLWLNPAKKLKEREKKSPGKWNVSHRSPMVFCAARYNAQAYRSQNKIIFFLNYFQSFFLPVPKTVFLHRLLRFCHDARHIFHSKAAPPAAAAPNENCETFSIYVSHSLIYFPQCICIKSAFIRDMSVK